MITTSGEPDPIETSNPDSSPAEEIAFDEDASSEDEDLRDIGRFDENIYEKALTYTPEVDLNDTGGESLQRNRDHYKERVTNFQARQLHEQVLPEIRVHYTQRAIDRAAQVHEYHNILHWSDKKLSAAFDNGIFENCHLTSEDVKTYRKIYGPCIACLKGKMTAAGVPNENKSTPETVLGRKWEMDFQFIKDNYGKRPILTFTEVVSGLIVSIRVGSRSKKDFVKAIKEFKSYLDKVFKLTHTDTINITSDQESVFGLVEKYISYARLTRVAPDQHAKRVERAHRRISDVMRTIHSSLPYKLLCD